jgi:hypothetical protein
MISLASLIERFEAECLRLYRHLLLPSQRRALSAMKACRTAASRQLLAHCPACDQRLLVPHSCGHRSCPHCQHHESQRWLERQLARAVPATYFLVTFTLPAQLRPLAWAHQRVLYDLMIRASWETLRTFARNDRHLQGEAGAIAVLHTQSRALDYHPHVHLVMPGATENGEVTFRYRHAKHQRWEYRTLPGAEFLALVLQHVLPKGLRRTRNFSFLHPNSQRAIRLLQWLFGRDPKRLLVSRPRPPLTCPSCGAPMIVVRTRLPARASPTPIPIAKGPS